MSESANYFDQLPPELIALLSSPLSLASLTSLILTCRRFHEILQPELESRLTPDLAEELLSWAAVSKPHIVAKLLSPPHSVPPRRDSWYFNKTPLHIAVKAGSIETARLLLEAGANPAAACDQEDLQALHIAAQKKNPDMIKLLLDHGAPIDSVFGSDGCSETALHVACLNGHLESVELLIARGANIFVSGHSGPALGFAVRSSRLEVMKCLLRNGADATVTVPLFAFLDGAPPPPVHANLLYVAMSIRHPWLYDVQRRARREFPPWEPLPLKDDQKQIMALLLAHGSSKDAAMETISSNLTAMAKAAGLVEEEFVRVVTAMIKEAEDLVPSLS